MENDETFRNFLKTAGLIGVYGALIHNWEVSEVHENNDVELEFSYTDSDGLIYSFEFTKGAIDNVVRLENGVWELTDTMKDTSEIIFYKLTRIV